MSIAAAVLGLAREFEFDGRTLRFRPLTYEALARFGLWLEERAAAALFRAAAGGYADRAELQAAHLNNVAAGEYEPGGAAFGRATNTPAGGRKVLALMLELPPDEAERAAWDVFADEAAFGRALALCGEINSDPQAAAARRRPGRPATPSP